MKIPELTESGKRVSGILVDRLRKIRRRPCQLVREARTGERKSAECEVSEDPNRSHCSARLERRSDRPRLFAAIRATRGPGHGKSLGSTFWWRRSVLAGPQPEPRRLPGEDGAAPDGAS
jgi:hypothetical protein